MNIDKIIALGGFTIKAIGQTTSKTKLSWLFKDKFQRKQLIFEHFHCYCYFFSIKSVRNIIQ